MTTAEPTILPERLARLPKIKILKGKHETINGGACLVEVAGWLRGELDDHAPCVCPVVAAFCRRFNDSVRGDARRTKLLRELAPLIGGTRSTRAVELKRAYLAADWAVRDSTPAFLDLVPALSDHAAALRALPSIVDKASAEAAQPTIVRAREAARVAWSAYAAHAAAAAAADDRKKINALIARRQKSAVQLIRRMCEVPL